jgi:hypothetical protein
LIKAISKVILFWVLVLCPLALLASKPKAIFIVKAYTQDRQHYLLQALHPTQFLVTVDQGSGNLSKGEAIVCEIDSAKDDTKYTSIVLRCHELKLKVNEVWFDEEK